MAQESTITTQYTPDVPRVLSANYRMDRSDRIFLDEQILGAHHHLSDSLIRGQIGSNFVLASGSAALEPGDLFCAAPEQALELPSAMAVRKVTKATTLALAAAGLVLGVAVKAAQPGTWVRGALEGIIGNSVTGLAPGAAGPVRASSAGRAERVAALSSGDYPIGYVDGYGNLSLARERAVGAGGGGGGGYTTVLDEGAPQPQRSTLNFVGGGVTVTDVGSVTQVAITSTPPPTGTAVGQTQLWDGSAWQAGALDLADADARTGTLPAGNGGTGIAGAGGTANRVLTTTNGATWAAGLVALATMVSGLLPAANFADGSATSVFGRSAGTSGVQASIAAASDGQTLRRAAGVLGFGALDLASANAVTGLLPLANLTGGAAVGQVLRNTTGNVPAWGALDLADTDAVTGLLPYANLASGSATSVLGRSAGTTGVLASIAATADGQVLQRVAGALTWATVGLSSLAGGTAVGQVLRNTTGNVPAWGAVDLADTDAVTGLLPHANLANLAGLSVFGRSANTSGVMAAITGADGQALRVSGTTLGFGTLATAAYATSSVTLAKIADGTASSVLGRSAATAGAYADIVSTADGQVLRRGASGVIGWGAVDLADTDAVTGLLPHANVASLAGLSVFGRASNTSGVMAAITGTEGQVLRVSGGVLGFGSVDVGTTIADGSLPLSKLLDGTAASVVGRAGATSGPHTDIASTADGQVLRRAAGTVGWGALDLADTDGVTGQLAFANMANLSALSVLGRASSTSGVMAAITGSAFQVLSVAGDGLTLGFGTLSTGNIGDAQVTLAKIDDGPAVSVVGRSAATSGVRGNIIASADGQVLRRAGGTLSFGALDLADTDGVTGQLPVANLANLVGLSVLGRSSNASGVMGPITGADGQVLRVSGTTLAFGSIAAGAIGDGTLPIAKLADGTAASIFGRSAATSGPYADIASSADGQVLRRAAGVVGWGAVDLADTDAVTGLLPHANLATLGGLSVLGRSANTTGGMAAITGADGQILRVSGTTLGFGTLATAGIGNSQVTLAKLADGTAASLLGRSAATVGAYADIASSADGQVLRRSGGTLAFGALDLADTDAVIGLLPFANIASLAGLSVFGRSTNSSGVMAAITGTADQVLRVNTAGTSLVFGQITAGALADGTVPVTKLVDGAAASVLGRSQATVGGHADIVSSADGQVLRRAAGVLAWGALDLADADAVTGLLPGTNVSPNFGSQNITTTGDLIVGASPADSGDFRVNQGFTMQGRNAAGLANAAVLRWGTTADTVILGNGNAGYDTSVFGDLIAISGIQTVVIGPNIDVNGFVDAGSYVAIGASPAASGALRLTNNEFINFKSSGGTTVTGIGMSSSDRISIGSSSSSITAQDYGVGSGGNFNWAEGGNALAILQANVFELRGSVNSLRFDQAVASPAIYHEDISTAGLATANKFSIHAQNRTGTGATVGAELELASGTGATPGPFTCKVGGTAFLSADSTTVYLGNVSDTYMSIDGTNNRVNFAAAGAAPSVSVGASLIAIGPTPAASGNIRLSHNTSLRGRDSAGATDRTGVRWGATGNDIWTFGDGGGVTEVVGTAVRIGVGSFSETQFEVTTLATNREVVALFLGSSVSTTQMPADTGDKVLFWAEGTGPTTPGATGRPSDGGILWNDAQYGLQWKSKYNVETTLGMRGANATVKRRIVEWKSDLTVFQTVSTSLQTACSFDATNFNGQTFSDGLITVRGKCLSFGGANNPGYAEVVAVFRVSSGALSLIGTRNGFDAAGSGDRIGGGLVTAAIDFSGTTIRMRVTPFASGGQLMSHFEVHAAEEGN